MTSSQTSQYESVSFCSDQELDYLRSRTPFTPGRGLLLDKTYRLAHLPLVAPDHPAAIPAQTGTFYQMGRHPPVVSLVMLVPAETLFGSTMYQELDAELRAAPFAQKLAWNLVETRRSKLHATICSSLSIGDPPFILDEACRQLFGQIRPVRAQIRGLFSGNVNVGRLYLRVYPELRNGSNAFHLVQRAMRRRITNLYLIGLHNFTDNLTATEARALSELIDRWWNRAILNLEVDQLHLLSASDDLVLDSSICDAVSLAWTSSR